MWSAGHLAGADARGPADPPVATGEEGEGIAPAVADKIVHPFVPADDGFARIA